MIEQKAGPRRAAGPTSAKLDKPVPPYGPEALLDALPGCPRREQPANVRLAAPGDLRRLVRPLVHPAHQVRRGVEVGVRPPQTGRVRPVAPPRSGPAGSCARYG